MMFFGLPIAILHFSLFFTDQDLAKIDNLESAHSNKIHGKNENNTLVLKGILYRSDLDTWTVWINETCISSRKQQSIQGWRIVKVSQDSVVLVSSDTGQKKELHLDQYSDNDDASETVIDAHEHEPAVFTETHNSQSDDEESMPRASDGLVDPSPNTHKDDLEGFQEDEADQEAQEEQEALQEGEQEKVQKTPEGQEANDEYDPPKPREP